jgi:hypothetical protein
VIGAGKTLQDHIHLVFAQHFGEFQCLCKGYLLIDRAVND